MGEEPFTLSWEEMVDLYETFLMYGTIGDIQDNLCKRLQNELQPRNIVRGLNCLTQTS